MEETKNFPIGFVLNTDSYKDRHEELNTIFHSLFFKKNKNNDRLIISSGEVDRSSKLIMLGAAKTPGDLVSLISIFIEKLINVNLKIITDTDIYKMGDSNLQKHINDHEKEIPQLKISDIDLDKDSELLAEYTDKFEDMFSGNSSKKEIAENFSKIENLNLFKFIKQLHEDVDAYSHPLKDAVDLFFDEYNSIKDSILKNNISSDEHFKEDKVPSIKDMRDFSLKMHALYSALARIDQGLR